MTWLDDNRAWLDRARERHRPRSVEPLTLRVWLRGPVAWDDYDGTTIEGALQFAVVIRETGHMPDDVFADCEPGTFADIPIPIADEERAGRRIACASWGVPSPLATASTRWRRKRARTDILGGSGKVIINGGPYKSLNIPTPTLAAPYLDFHVRGDRALLADLLPDVGALGRARAGGLGAVLGTEILDDPDDRSLRWLGRPMRAVPVADDYEAAITFEVGTYALREATTRAPYWHRATRALCAVPTWRMQEAAA